MTPLRTTDDTRLPWHRSLRFRLVTAAIVVEALMLSLLLFNSYRLVSEALEAQTRTRLVALSPLINASLAGRVFQRDHSEIDAILHDLMRSESSGIGYIIVLDTQNRLLAHAGDGHAYLPPAPPGDDRSVRATLHDLSYDTHIPLTLAGDTVVGSVRFGLSLATLVNLRDNVLRQSLLIAGAEILLSLLLLASGGYLLTRHLATLLTATRRVASADYTTPIAIGSRDEIGVLADNFNLMTATIRARIEQLAESESRFRAIFDAAGDAIFIFDANDGRLLDVNRRMCEMYRCTREQALAASPADLMANTPPYTPKEAAEKLRLACVSGPQTFDWLARTLDGETFWVEVSLRLALLGNSNRIISLVRDISERKRHQQELEFLAHHDALTHLPNRVLLADRLYQAMARVRRKERLLAVVYLDLDGFKPVNDSLGHDIGDRLLKLVAQRLKETTRADDTVCRLGGDEFVMLIGDLLNVEEGVQTFERVLATIATPYHVDAHAISISASLGVTLYPLDDADADTLLRHADHAMYAAKQAGRNRFHIFDAAQDPPD